MHKTKIKHTHGIMQQISIAFILPIFFVILVGMLSYKQSERGLQKKYEEAALTTLRMTTQYIDLGLQLVEAEALKYAYDSNMNEYFMGLHERNASKKSQTISTMQSGMKSARTTNQFIHDIYIITKSDITMLTTKQMTGGTGNGFFEDFNKELENFYGTSINSMWMDSHQMLDERFDITPNDYILSYYCTSTNSKAGVVIDVSPETIEEAIHAMDMGNGSTVGFITKEGREITSGETPGFSLTGKDYYEKFLASEDNEITSYITENNQEYLLLASKSSAADAVLYAAVPRDAVVAEAESIKSITVFLVLTSCVIVILIASLISVKIGKRMSILSSGLNRASSGDLTVKMNIKGNDEFADIGRSINLMLEHMHHLVQNTTDNVLQVSETSQEVKNTSETVNNHSEEISAAIGKINTGISDQQENANECQQKMDTLSNEIKMMLKEIETIEQFSASSNEMIKRGTEQMRSLSESSSSTVSITSKVIRDINNLMEKIRSIDTFVDMINDISAQTNLLSLNASIEAARAGSSGRGFSVVAEEIRKLADSSLQAAEQIKNTVNEVRIQVDETTGSATAAEKSVLSQTETVQSMDAILEQMNAGMAQLLTSVHAISQNVERVDADRHSTKKAVANITEIIHITSSSASKVGVLANELLQYAETMNTTSEHLTNSTYDLKNEMASFIL